MEPLSSEISQKMRSAVKAKLMELGDGAYIDDELPDYVMIMVANKRSKQQMITDLTLFLDSQTELFVTWLHEVLAKLQEVTVQPNPASTKKKKETKKKDKKKIADVVAEDVIKQNKNIDTTTEAAKKEERSDTPPLPSISEILIQHQKQKVVETNQKQKELIEIQKKIMETKKKIQAMSEDEEKEKTPPVTVTPKKSIAERIGSTSSSRKKHKREDRELYVPSSRRGTETKLVSRVVKAPPKVEISSDGEDNEKVVSSVIKVKPRPKLSPTRQASKNLLLKAMADAQKSAVQATKESLKRRLKSRSPSPKITQRIGTSRGQKLYTKSFRDRMNREILTRRQVGKTKDNIVVQVKGVGKEEYIPEPVSDKNEESDNDYIYIPQQIEAKDDSMESFENEDYDMEQKPTQPTQFIVTVDDSEEFKAKFKHRLGAKNGVENKNTLFRKVHSPSNDNDRQSPIITRQEYQEKYLKQKEIKKIIIRNDSEDDEVVSPRKQDKSRSRHTEEESDGQGKTPPRPRSREATPKPQKRKRSPITFDLKDDDEDIKRKRSRSHDKDHQIISIRKSNEFRKFDNVPDFLMPIPADKKPKERCKFYPSCTKFECEFFHPLSNCKAFPNCKFADKCLYIHPKCKYDLSCTNNNCNYSHTRISSNAPPLSSHVVPVQNYKSINPLRTSGGNTDSTMMCKYYPHCTNNTCTFYHPKNPKKACKYGYNCMNKMECSFYHADVVQVRDKFKWVASAV